MKKNGFTLIELLGVIIILALLMLLIFPSIINSIKNTSNKTDSNSLELIYNLSDIYVSKNINKFPKKNGNMYVILIEDLISNGNLPSNIELSDVDNINNKCIQVTYNDGFKYELKDTCEEKNIICSSDSTELSPGTKYDCQVNETSNYTFYLLSKNNKSGEIITDTTSDKEVASINLIMEANINLKGEPIKSGTFTASSPETVEWINESDYYKLSGQTDKTLYFKWQDCLDCTSYGPVTSMNYLYKATSSWNYIPDININYEDEGCAVYDFGEQNCEEDVYGYGNVITNDKKTKITKKDGTITASYHSLKARMPMVLEIRPLCNDLEIIEDNESMGFSGDCVSNLWLWNYLNQPLAGTPAYEVKDQTYVSGMYGYRLLSSHYDYYGYSKNDWMKNSMNAVLDYGGYLCHTVITSEGVPDGIRPVITVPVENLENK